MLIGLDDVLEDKTGGGTYADCFYGGAVGVFEFRGLSFAAMEGRGLLVLRLKTKEVGRGEAETGSKKQERAYFLTCVAGAKALLTNKPVSFVPLPKEPMKVTNIKKL